MCFTRFILSSSKLTLLLMLIAVRYAAAITLLVNLTDRTVTKYQNLQITWSVVGEISTPNEIDHFLIEISCIADSTVTRYPQFEEFVKRNVFEWNWRVDCSLPTDAQIQITLIAQNNKQKALASATVLTENIKDNAICYGPIAEFVETDGMHVAALSKQSIRVRSAVLYRNVTVYVNDVSFCEFQEIAPNMDFYCQNVTIPCLAIGTTISLHALSKSVYDDKSSDPLSITYQVTSVSRCLPRLRIIDCNGHPIHSITPQQPFYFALQLHPTDDFKLYENFNIYQKLNHTHSLIIHSDCLQIPNCNNAKSTLFHIGCYTVPCFQNCLQDLSFQLLYTKLNSSYDFIQCIPGCTKSMVTSSTRELSICNIPNKSCILEFLPPRVISSDCSINPFQFDCCSGCWMWRVDDIVTFGIRIGCDTGSIISKYKLSIIGCEMDAIVLFRRCKPFPRDSCGVHKLADWKIPLRLWRRSDLKVVLEYSYCACGHKMQSDKLVFKLPKISI